LNRVCGGYNGIQQRRQLICIGHLQSNGQEWDVALVFFGQAHGILFRGDQICAQTMRLMGKPFNQRRCQRLMVI